MHHPTDRIIHTTAFVKPVVEQWLEREIARVMRVCYMCCVGVRCSAIAHGWVGWGGGAELFLCPYPPKVQAPLDQGFRAVARGAVGCMIDSSLWTH